MIPVTDALQQIFDLISPLDHKDIPLGQAAGRVLAIPATATRDQPPFASSAMDGYAINSADATVGKTIKIIGEAAAGHGYQGTVKPGETVRIFTGAPVPNGADRVVIQEDVTRKNTDITLNSLEKSNHIRPKGGDFKIGDTMDAPRLLSAGDTALLAAMNIPRLSVTRRPVVALIATGDELVMPGETPNHDQIIASNSFGLAALARQHGAEARTLPIARDNPASLKTAFGLAKGADLIITIGGASVGDHDIVGDVADQLGGARKFYRIAMRPGKPLMAGTIGNSIHLGFPGNPVSSMVCGHIFMLPALCMMLGLPAQPAPRLTALMGHDLGKNGPREHYMRALVKGGRITSFGNQDSALLSVFSQTNALLVRPVNAPAIAAGEPVSYVPI